MHIPTTTIVLPLKWDNSNLLNDSSQAFTRKFYCSFQKIKLLLVWFRWRYWSVTESTSFFCAKLLKMIRLFRWRYWSVTECTSFFCAKFLFLSIDYTKWLATQRIINVIYVQKEFCAKLLKMIKLLRYLWYYRASPRQRRHFNVRFCTSNFYLHVSISVLSPHGLAYTISHSTSTIILSVWFKSLFV